MADARLSLLEQIHSVRETYLKDALLAVIELHKEDYGFCMICPDFDYPCETIKAIERELN